MSADARPPDARPSDAWPGVHAHAIDEAERLAVLREYDILDTPPERAFDDIVRLARRICDTPIALVSLVDADRQWFKARTGLDAIETPLSQSVCAHGVAGRTDLVIPDLTADPRTCDNPLVAGPPHLRFYAGALLEAPGGHALGMLCVIDFAPRPGGLTEAQAEDLGALARQVVAQLELRRGVGSLGVGLVSARAAARRNAARAAASEAARARLWEDTARAAAAQDAGGTGAFDIDFATGRIRASEAFGRIYGLPPAAEYRLEAVAGLVVAEDRGLLSTHQAQDPEGTLAAAEYRIRRADDGALRWVERRGAFMRDPRGRAMHFVGTLFDITDRKQAELRQAALLALGDQLRTVADTGEIAGIAARILGETLGVSRAGYAALDLGAESCRVERDWTAPGVPSLAGLHGLGRFGETVARLQRGAPLAVAEDAANPKGGARVPDLCVPGVALSSGGVSNVGAPGVGAQMTVPLVDGTGLVGLLFVHSDAPRSWSRDEIGFAQVVADRTYAALAKIEAERHQNLLNQELSHRLKNTLSMVQAIASQTLRGATAGDALDGFNHRLITLGTAHDLLLQKAWASATLHSCVTGALSRHAGMERIITAGADLTIGPRAVLAISMLLHELATNAVKYGALSVATGTIRVEWSIDHTAPEACFTLTWTETGGPPVTAPDRNGFGSRLIRAGLTGTGGAALDYRPAGLVATFSTPLARMI